MRICDICKTNHVIYTPYVTTNECGGETLELCNPCYHKLKKREQHHAYLAYKETVEEITGEAPKKKSWWNIFKR